MCYPGDDLGLHLSFDQRYFDFPTVERLLAEFKRLLLALVQGFEGEVSELPMLGADEQRFLLEDCNRTERAYPLEQSYIAQFEAQVAAHPERTVARCLEASYDYAGLNLAANRLGHALVAAGVKVDQPVALLAERGLPLLGMIVGSFKAGAGYLPLDPGLPAARLQSIIQLSRTPVLVCSAACAEQGRQLLGELEATVRPQLLVWEDIQASPVASHNPGIHSGPHNLAYVIYTSGSTGLPKGVMVEQRGMLNNQLSKVPYLALSEHDVIAQTASQSFDISVWQFLAAPLFGAKVEIVPNAIAHDPQGLLAHVQATGITVLESVPSLIQGMLANDHQALDGLRWMLPTGEAMPPGWPRNGCNVTRRSAWSTRTARQNAPMTWRSSALMPRRPKVATYRSARRPTTTACTCSAKTRHWCRWARWASCVWRAPAWGVAMLATRCALHWRSSLIRTVQRASACTAPATWRGSARTGCWSTSGASTIR
ncbi:D-alanine--D-alanyl carrier protein ligase [Pseudomonas sp. MM221]|nr:D-alanine--D-alanyl carrier protein ligase [Pseudomonas sp. MM221]